MTTDDEIMAARPRNRATLSPDAAAVFCAKVRDILEVFDAHAAEADDDPSYRRRSPSPSPSTRAPAAPVTPLCRKAMLGTGLPCARARGHSDRCDTIGDWPPIG